MQGASCVAGWTVVRLCTADKDSQTSCGYDAGYLQPCAPALPPGRRGPLEPAKQIPADVILIVLYISGTTVHSSGFHRLCEKAQTYVGTLWQVVRGGLNLRGAGGNDSCQRHLLDLLNG